MVKVICDYQLYPYTERGVGVKVYGEEYNMLISKDVGGVNLEVSIYSDSRSRVTLGQHGEMFSLKIDHKTKFEWVEDVLKFSYKENSKPILGAMFFHVNKVVITMNNLVMNTFSFTDPNGFGSNVVKCTLKMLIDHFINNQKQEPEKTINEMINEFEGVMTNRKKHVWRKSMGISCTRGSVKRSNPVSVFPEQ